MAYSVPFDPTWTLFLAILLTVIGIAAMVWLIFFVVYGKELPRKDKIVGTSIRLVLMSIFLGFGLFFWTLVDVL